MLLRLAAPQTAASTAAVDSTAAATAVSAAADATLSSDVYQRIRLVSVTTLCVK